MTVRNSMGDVVQFMYGADGLDPAEMEGNERPVDLSRIMQHIKVTLSQWACCHRNTQIDSPRFMMFIQWFL